MRRLFTALTASSLLVGLMAPAAVGGSPVAGSPVLGQLRKADVARIDPALLKAQLSANRAMTVMLQLSGSAANAAPDQTPAGRESAASSLRASQRSIEGEVQATGGTVVGRYQYAYNGMKVRTTAGQLQALSALPGVVAVRAIHTYSVDNTQAIPYIGAPSAWGTSAGTGAGQTIAVIDTGIDYTHADFGGAGTPQAFTSNDPTVVEPGTFPTAKVIAGWDFAGDSYDADGKLGSATPTPDGDPLDCYGHGTHVAGTAAGDGVTASHQTYTGPYTPSIFSSPAAWSVGPGVAPRATLVDLKIFGCQGTTGLVTDALEWVAKYNATHAHGIGVVNLSLGSAFGSNDDPDAVAVNNLVATGVVVVAAAGNENAVPFVSGPPASATGAIAAAAVDAVPSVPLASIAFPVDPAVPAINQNAAPGLPLTGPLHVLGDLATPADASVHPNPLGCDASDYDAATSGAIVVVRRGGCPFVQKGAAAQAAGAIGIIVVNREDTAPGDLPTFLGYNPELFSIPMIGTDLDAAAALVANEGATVTIGAAGSEPNPTYRQIADFSSSGPRFGDNALKPDVAAPGVGLLSALKGSGWNGTTYSGTSMATAVTTGAAALVRAAHPTWTPLKVKTALSNTADASALIVGYDPLRAGAGVIRVDRAVRTRALATTSDGTASLSYGYEPIGGAYAETRIIHLSNTGPVGVTYTLSATSPLVTAWPRTIRVPAHSTRSITVTAHLSRAQVAALPSADPFLTGNLSGLDSQSGVVIATPHTGAWGYYPLRVPYLLVPRGLSDVRSSLVTRHERDESPRVKAISVTNRGVHDGVADIYALGLLDPRGDGANGTDIRAAGVQVFGDPANPAMQFAVNTWDRFSTAAPHQVQIDVDTNGDHVTDYYVLGWDEGAAFGTTWDGVFLSIIVDASFNLVDAWYADAPKNGSTYILPLLASDLGLTAGHGSFSYNVSIWDGITGGPGFTGGADFTNGWASFNPYHPAQSTDGAIAVPAGTSASIPVWVSHGESEHHGIQGWMVVSIDDANGAAQADLLFP